VTSGPSFADDLVAQTLDRVAERPGCRIVILGMTATAFRVRTAVAGTSASVLGIADPDRPTEGAAGALPWRDAGQAGADLLVVADDARKERLLRAFDLLPLAGNLPDVVVAGTAHLDFRDATYDRLDAPSLVPSYANGYANTRVHLYQCLAAAAANGLSGAIVEFGAFKGGTTAWLARTAAALELHGPVIAFDSWDGFPDRGRVLDMYAHPRCVYKDIGAVRGHLEPLGVELVAGDIARTAAERLAGVPILLAFVDTDNYTPAHAALEAIADNVVVGGAIVFDHYTTVPEFVYTLGERMAADDVLSGRGLLHLHGTGVFVRIS
jgi:O-methyltransferase